MSKIVVKNGDAFGMLTVLKEVESSRLPSGQTNRMFECVCSCGSVKKYRLVHLRHGRTTSCGCSITIDKLAPHGKSNTKLYNVWRGMKNRVSSYHSESHLYKDKGIDICDEWKNSFNKFEEFALNNGWKPGLQIDRKDNSKGYYKENCRFVSNIVNVNNRDNTLYVNYHGRNVSFMILLREKKLMNKMGTIRSRIKNGWNHNDAFDIPIRELKRPTEIKINASIVAQNYGKVIQRYYSSKGWIKERINGNTIKYAESLGELCSRQFKF